MVRMVNFILGIFYDKLKKKKKELRTSLIAKTLDLELTPQGFFRYLFIHTPSNTMVP